MKKIFMYSEQLEEFQWNFYDNIKSHQKQGWSPRRFIFGKTTGGFNLIPPPFGFLRVSFIFVNKMMVCQMSRSLLLNIILIKLVHSKGNRGISEERITPWMKKIFTEELEKQQKSLLIFISGKFEIAIKEIKNI